MNECRAAWARPDCMLNLPFSQPAPTLLCPPAHQRVALPGGAHAVVGGLEDAVGPAGQAVTCRSGGWAGGEEAHAGRGRAPG